MEYIEEGVRKGYGKFKSLETSIWFALTFLFTYILFKLTKLIIAGGAYKLLLPKLKGDMIYYSFGTGLIAEVVAPIILFIAASFWASYLTDKIFFWLHYIEAWEYFFEYRSNRMFYHISSNIIYTTITFLVLFIGYIGILKFNYVAITTEEFSQNILNIENKIIKVSELDKFDIRCRYSFDPKEIFEHSVLDSRIEKDNITFQPMLRGEELGGIYMSKTEDEVSKMFFMMAKKNNKPVTYSFDIKGHNDKNNTVIENISKDALKEKLSFVSCKKCLEKIDNELKKQ
ncbi:hypothetical protein SAMN02745163_02441 [Clostridium cavendishii DSM 21758]|uniref:Uncharacterized protein n=1 Tax=Clostridium cavendishii DSM 21758 TaxID=1121302 RepID=A0A1M6LNL4_9CLOT|nr:hypothetical protein [Clostridium cavendishii]SHJ72801.1 hypothetical protein SAMN02745163_02441 [Clostridium cavendishii DSM 21758]